MMKSTLIKNATIINENKIFKGDVLIENEKIKTFYIAERAILTGD